MAARILACFADRSDLDDANSPSFFVQSTVALPFPLRRRSWRVWCGLLRRMRREALAPTA